LQDITLNFSRAGHGPIVNENHAARNFKAGEVLAAVIHDLFFGNRLASFQFEENCYDFHQPIIGYTDSHGLFHSAVSQKNCFDIRTGNVSPADSDHVFDAAHQSDVAIAADDTKVAGAKPAFFIEGFRSFLRIIEVALGDAPTLEANLAGFSGRQELSALGLANANFDSGHGPPHGGHAKLQWIVHRARGPAYVRFRQAIWANELSDAHLIVNSFVDFRARENHPLF